MFVTDVSKSEASILPAVEITAAEAPEIAPDDVSSKNRRFCLHPFVPGCIDG